MVGRDFGAGTRKELSERFAAVFSRWLGPGLAVTIGAGLLAGAASAQDEPIPGSADPSRIEQELQPPPVPRAEPGAVLQVPEQPVPPGAEEVRFVLQDITFDGNTVYGPEELRSLWADLAGKEVSLADIYGVARSATVKYRTDGYILSQVIVPPQDVEQGMVRLQVIEGFVGEVTIEGDIQGRRDILEAYGEKIKASRPLLAQDLERYLLLAGDLAGVTARGVLTPSATVPGASDLAIVIEHKGFDGFAQIDNRGSRFIGPWLFVFGGQINSLAGLYEQVSLVFATSWEPEELQYGEISVAVPVTDEGTLLTLAFSASHSEPGFELEDQQIDSRDVDGTIDITHPLIRTREANLSVGGSFTVRETDTDQHGNRIIDDSLRVLRAHGSYDFVDSIATDLLGEGWQSVNLVQAEASVGLPIFGATDGDDHLTSRSEGDGDFLKFVGTVSRLQGLLFPGFNLYVAATGQIASEALLSSEEFGVGGSTFGRGYDPSEITGDDGVATTVELQYGNATDYSFLESYQVYTFWDFGKVYNQETPGVDDNVSLSSAGGGIRVNFIPELSGNFEVARQLTRVSDSSTDDDKDTRFLFGLTGRF
jgi:hemolysin activation/secretion protein